MLLLVGALGVELRSVRERAPRGEIVDVGGVGVLRTGAGLPAAEAAAALIRQARPSRVLHVGLAGGLRGGLGMGDLVIVTGTSREALAVDVGGALPAIDEAQGAELLRPALALLPNRMAQGAILTVDRFVDDATTKQAIGRAGPFLACEMEAAAIAAGARDCGADYVGLRSISDPCDVTVLPAIRSAEGIRRLLSRRGGIDAWRTAKGLRRSIRALDRAVPAAIAALQATPSTSAPASFTNSAGT